MSEDAAHLAQLTARIGESIRLERGDRPNDDAIRACSDAANDPAQAQIDHIGHAGPVIHAAQIYAFEPTLWACEPRRPDEDDIPETVPRLWTSDNGIARAATPTMIGPGPGHGGMPAATAGPGAATAML